MDIKGLTRRELVVHDALAFASLTLITAILFAVTLFLFRSFSTHRAEQAKVWEERGRTALNSGRPEDAIQALRTALTLAPDTRASELMLAQSLAAAGPAHADEAYNYFLELWETQPGDGQINLELARLGERRGDNEAAARYFRAAIDGRWDENGALHRRQERLELARYLIDLHNKDAARAELLIVGGNWRDDPAVQAEVARLLAQTGDTSNALLDYRRALALKPDAAIALEAGRLAYGMGSLDQANAILQVAPQGSGNDAIAALRARTERLLALLPSGKLSAAERVRRIATIRTIARQRLEACTKQEAAQPDLTPLADRWKAGAATVNASGLLRDPALQETATQLVYDTEIATSRICGPPAGDDELLLHLAQASKAETR